MRLTGIFAVAAVGVAALTASATAQTTKDEEFHWTGKLASGQTLEIRGVSGDIRAERATGTDIQVDARKRGRRSDPADVEIVVVPHDGGVTICAVYPSRDGRENECRPGGGRNNTESNDVSVTWTIRVPDGVNLEAHDVNGDVTISDIGGDVVASTVNGDVDASTRGTVDAHTVNGSITASLGRADWDGRVAFKTVNGSVTVKVPDGLNARLDASTVNGGIETDFPITIRGRFGHRSLRGTIGDGGRDLEIGTVNGSIRIRKSG
jgi:Toastrack DUF4097